MAVRRATPNDLQAMVELGSRLADRTIYAGIPRDRQLIVRTMVSCMSSQFGCAFVAEREGKITGMLLGVAEQFWWSRARYATDLILHSEYAGDGLALSRAFLAWAQKVPGVVEVTMGQSSGLDVERSERFYQFLGLRKVGGLYTKILREDVSCQASSKA